MSDPRGAAPDRPVLVTVSNVLTGDLLASVERGDHPRLPQVELAKALAADVIDYGEALRAAGTLGRLLGRIAPHLLLAWTCFARRRRYAAIVTDGEKIGLPLAVLMRGAGGPRPRHIMIAHVLSVAKKRLLLSLLGAHHAVDRFLVYAEAQRRLITRRWGIPARRVVLTPYMVDERFFSPGRAAPRTDAGPTPMAYSIGRERRDYPTLLDAAKHLDVQVTISAASPWSRNPDSTRGKTLPANVQLTPLLSRPAIRQLYAESRFLVMPLLDVDYQAGITAILEAMAMERAVIATRSKGYTDALVHGETGLYVPPGDVKALRSAMERLLRDPEEAARMGRAGERRLHDAGMTLDAYVARLARITRETLAERAARGSSRVDSRSGA